MSTYEQRSAGQTTQLWTQRFWTRIKDRTGLSIHGVLSVVRFTDIEQRIQGFEGDPESAADEQITKWRKKYQMIDKALRNHSKDQSRELKH